jgi:putative membrane protein
MKGSIKMQFGIKTNRITLLTVLSFFLALERAIAQDGSNYGGWCQAPWMMGGWGMGWFGMIFMLVFWVLVIVGLVFLIKWLIQTTSSGKTEGRIGPKVIDILKERYARGEISKEEFDTIKQDLQ